MSSTCTVGYALFDRHTSYTAFIHTGSPSFRALPLYIQASSESYSIYASWCA